jgi:hypothetical protein
MGDGMKQTRQFCDAVFTALDRLRDPHRLGWAFSAFTVLATDAVMWSVYSHHYQWLIWLDNIPHIKLMSNVESQARAFKNIPMSEFAWKTTLITVFYMAVLYLIVRLVCALSEFLYMCFSKSKSDLATDPGKLWFLADLLANLLPAKEREQIELDNYLPEMIDRYKSVSKAKCIVLVRIVSSIFYCWLGWALRILEAWGKVGS